MHRAPRLQSCGCINASGVTCHHQRARKAAFEQRRPSARARGYDSKWQRESKAWLAQPGHEWCACGCGRRADMVDHKVAHKGNQTLFWDRANWQPMHRGCNSRKAVRSEGGFGRTPTPGVVTTSAKEAGTAAGPRLGTHAIFSSRDREQNR